MIQLIKQDFKLIPLGGQIPFNIESEVSIHVIDFASYIQREGRLSFYINNEINLKKGDLFLINDKTACEPVLHGYLEFISSVNTFGRVTTITFNQHKAISLQQAIRGKI